MSRKRFMKVDTNDPRAILDLAVTVTIVDEKWNEMLPLFERAAAIIDYCAKS